MYENGWLVINARAPVDRSRREDMLVKVFEEIISEFKDRVESWHFLWEAEPYHHTLLLRFFGAREVIDELEGTFEKFFTEEGIEYTPDETYDGEADSYGDKGWEYIMRILYLGSDFALDLIQKERLGTNDDFNKPLIVYIDRLMHLFLNQLLTRVVEHDILFKFSVHRYVISKIGGENYHKVSLDLGEKTPEFFHVLKGSIDDFLKKKGYNL